ncbi:MAG: alpha-L-fucosidase [Aquabacterium sp.]|nr:alpha-L-fucosidase [Ferruginibacter sp.]
MTFRKQYFILFSSLLLPVVLLAQIKKVLPPAPVYPLPSATQLQWHQMEMNAFIHFNINTFTDKEWGYGDEPPALFAPTNADANQWAKTLSETGFKQLILTCKHHDGFCLWPSKYTSRSVKESPYKNGKGDIVKEASDAAKKYGLKFGVYLSPWDRSRADYGTPAYLNYYRNQLKELFTRYGPVFEMWFDGANGGDGYYGGAKEKRTIDGATYYNWPATLKLVRTMAPNILFFSDAGPGIRWVGNESGIAGKTNWNSINTDTIYAGKPGIEKLLNTGQENGSKWIPAEVDVSIRPGWFYHAKEDSLVKTPQQLLDIYLTSVGRGSTLLLNIPPDRRGLFHENDVKALYGFKALLQKEFGKNLAAKAVVVASNTRGNAIQFAAANITDGNNQTYWATDDGVTEASIEIGLQKTSLVKYIVLQENIKLGQRIKAFTVFIWAHGEWQKVADETTIGYKRILKIDPLETGKIKINITGSKASPVISAISVY